MMVTKSATAVCCVASLVLVGAQGPPPARDRLVRLGISVTTSSPVAEVTLGAGTIVRAAVVPGRDAVDVDVDGNRLRFTHAGAATANGLVRVLVGGLVPGTQVPWRLAVGSTPARTELAVYNENDPDRVRLVDRFDTELATTTVESPADVLLRGAPVRVAAGPPPLALAFYYPWYQHFNWASDRLQDQPLFQYSTEFPEELGRSLRDVRDAGLDGVIVSWTGDTDWNDRRLRFVLDEAQTLGVKVSILVESLLATEGPEGTVKPLSAGKMRRWLEKAFDRYASHPAFLTVRGVPVVFIYVADAFSVEDWRAITEVLTNRRPMLLMADSIDPASLDVFAGAFSYATTEIKDGDLPRFDATLALQTQTHDLLFGGARRIAAATVSPGYDDSLLQRDTTLVVGRDGGAHYERQWQAALAAQPDWVLVTSWNEFWENTHIEPSVRYGRYYQSRTRAWADLFHRRPPIQGAAPGGSR